MALKIMSTWNEISEENSRSIKSPRGGGVSGLPWRWMGLPGRDIRHYLSACCSEGQGRSFPNWRERGTHNGPKTHGWEMWIHLLEDRVYSTGKIHFTFVRIKMKEESSQVRFGLYCWQVLGRRHWTQPISAWLTTSSEVSSDPKMQIPPNSKPSLASPGWPGPILGAETQ